LGHLASVTKSITSLAFGIAISEGYIDSLGQRLYDVMPEKFPSDVQKRSITLEHCLTMRSGLAFDNDVFSVEIISDKPSDPIKYILKKPMYAEPGEKFYYRDCDPHLISYGIQRLTGKTLEQWTKERLFDPLGIADYHWVSDHKGTTTGAFGLWLKSRDMAKIGQMVLDHGRWQGVQIVDSSWVAISTQKQVETEHHTEPYIYHYGYYWWIIPRWNAFAAWGTGGNYIFIMPSKEMVIVMTSTSDVDADLFDQNLPSFEELIRPLLE
jgi:CubicO group peptidase (beta-lactamase class C family)